MVIVAEDSKEVELRGFYIEAYEFIEQHFGENRNVLVHCRGGRSRSATILCSYLMKKYEMGF